MAFLHSSSLVVLIACAAGMRFQRSRKPETKSVGVTVSTAPSTRGSFRGTFRDVSLWVEDASGPGTSSADSRLWVVEYTSAAQMKAERARAESAGLVVTLQEKLSLVLQGNVPSSLGYDACGSETDKTVISVADREVLERPMPAAAASKYLARAQTADPLTVQFLSQVSQQSITETLTTLQSYTSRNSQSGDVGLNPAAEYAATRLRNYGFQVTRDTFRNDMTPQIIAELRGTTNPDQVVVLGAHLDSTAGWSSSPTTRSPGSDDNGSGSSSVLEFAKIIAQSSTSFKNTLRLCLFTGEEQGLIGSRALASRWSDEGVNVIAMANVDMLGYRPPGTPITINLMNRVGDAALLDISRATTNTYLPGVANGNTTACCSDQQSFHENGFPAAGFFETPGTRVVYPQYHTSSDLLQYLDPEQITTQATAAFALTTVMAEISSSSPVPTPTPVPTPAPPTPAPGNWELTGTGCEIDGDCVQSKNHPSEYGNNEQCTIQLYGNFALTTEAFSTESGYDTLTIGGTQYSGSSGPPSGSYTGTILWASDYSVTRAGWRMCGFGS